MRHTSAPLRPQHFSKCGQHFCYSKNEFVQEASRAKNSLQKFLQFLCSHLMLFRGKFRKCVQKMENNIDICRNCCQVLHFNFRKFKIQSLKFPKPNRFFTIQITFKSFFNLLFRHTQRPVAEPGADDDRLRQQCLGEVQRQVLRKHPRDSAEVSKEDGSGASAYRRGPFKDTIE